MKISHILFIMLLTTTVSSCQNKSQDTSQKDIVKEKPECEALYNKYMEKASNMETDSAMFYINKTIKCDPSNNDYKYYKVQFLISIKDFKNAVSILNELPSDNDDPTLKMQKGILMLKIKDANSKKVLEECYTEFQKIKSPTSNNQFYKIALDNYFKGKDYSLGEVEKFKEQHKDKPYEMQNINALEGLIKSQDTENALFKLFNIRD